MTSPTATSHTALIARDNQVLSCDRNHGSYEIVAECSSPERAAFIVEACNSHERLIQLLQRAVESLEYVNSSHPEATGSAVRYGIIAEARAFLGGVGK